MKPTTEEATLDLNNIRQELEAMRNIEHSAAWLSQRADVDSSYYLAVRRKVASDISGGEGVEKQILERYPELL